MRYEIVALIGFLKLVQSKGYFKNSFSGIDTSQKNTDKKNIAVGRLFQYTSHALLNAAKYNLWTGNLPDCLSIPPILNKATIRYSY
jgi:hypothetical protein